MHQVANTLPQKCWHTHVTWKQKSSRAGFKATYIRGRNINGQFSCRLSAVYPEGSKQPEHCREPKLVIAGRVAPCCYTGCPLSVCFQRGPGKTPVDTAERMYTRSSDDLRTWSDRSELRDGHDARVYRCTQRGEHVWQISQDGKQLHLHLNSWQQTKPDTMTKSPHQKFALQFNKQKELTVVVTKWDYFV